MRGAHSPTQPGHPTQQARSPARSPNGGFVNHASGFANSVYHSIFDPPLRSNNEMPMSQ